MRRNIVTSTLWPIYFLCFFGVQYFSDWWLLKIAGIRGGNNFGDLGAVLQWSDCFKKVGSSVYGLSEGVCGNYNYGSALLRVFNLLEIAASQTMFWGIVGGVVFCIGLGLLAAFLVSQKAASPIVVGLVLSSPPIWLLLERANIDELIFFLLVIASFLLIRGFDFGAIAIISITALFKFYTLPLLLILAITSKSKKSRVIALCAFILVVPLIAIDFFKIQVDFPSGWFVSFGVPAIGFWINEIGEQFGLSWLHIGALTGHVLGLVVFVTSTAILRMFTKRTSGNLEGSNYQESVKKEIEHLFVILGSVFVICYLLGMNYDYRLIFVAVSGLTLVAQSQKVRLGNRLQYLLTLGLWLTCFSFGLQSFSFFLVMLIQFMGDIIISIFAAFLSLRLIDIIIKGFRQNMFHVFG